MLKLGELTRLRVASARQGLGTCGEGRLAIGKMIGTGGGWIAGSMSKEVANVCFTVFIDRQQDRHNMRKKPSGKLFDHPSDMEPFLPEDGDGGLAGTALVLIRKAERLRGLLHPITQKSVAQLVRSMNSSGQSLAPRRAPARSWSANCWVNAF